MEKIATKDEIQSMALFAEMNPEPVLRFDLHGRILQSNPAANGLFNKDSLIDHHIHEIIPETKKIDIQDLIKHDNIKNFQVEIDERAFSFNFRGINRLEACQIYGSEITERIKAQKKVESMALFAELNPEPVLRIDREGTILQANPAALNAFQVEELLGGGIQSFIEEIKETDVSALIRDSQIATIDAKVGNRYFRFILRGIAHLNICQIYGSDITERLEAQQQLESMAMFARLNPEPVLRFDSKGIILQANPAALESFDKISLLDENVKELIPELEEMEIPAFIKQNRIETIDISRDDKKYRFILKGINEINVVQTYGSDITQRVKAENQVKQQHKAIRDSIRYASRIQDAVLPAENILDDFIQDHFILFKPKDVVSGDFYWATSKEGKMVVVAADCTGHGVPGAFMSMLGISFLNEIVNRNDCCQASFILNWLRDKVKSTLSLSGQATDDGMDLSLIIYDPKEMKIQFSGAYNHLYLIQNDELNIYKANRMPIGNHLKDKEPFTNQVIDVKKGDVIYMMSDGFQDQFGGPAKHKFSAKRMQSLFLDMHKRPMREQKKAFDDILVNWMEDEKQIDDVLVMGLRL